MIAQKHKRKHKLDLPESSQSGFTIIESLIAIMVVAILMVAVSPVIVLAVANRVQARRVELASIAARTYIDGVRSGAIPAPSHALQLNEVNSSTKAFTSARNSFAAIPAPTTSALSCPNDKSTNATSSYPYCSNTTRSGPSLYCVDLEGGQPGGCYGTATGTKNLVIQAFRSATPSSDAKEGYLLGVRVYRADAFDGKTTLTTWQAKGQRQATSTGGLGDRTSPLVEVTTEIASTNTGANQYKDLCDRLGGCRQ